MNNMNSIQFIDLGLPNGTLWADRNLGAMKPEDIGLYFRFGELDSLTEESGEYKPIPFSKEANLDGKDNTNIACTIYDVAQMKFNINFCIPNITQINELIECCNKEYLKFSGIEGMKFTGPNGKFIFLPAGGRMENWIPIDENRLRIANEYGPEDKENYGFETWGFYWGSNRLYYTYRRGPVDPSAAAAVALNFSKDTDTVRNAWTYCRQGLLIRPTKYVNQSDNKWIEKYYLTDNKPKISYK